MKCGGDVFLLAGARKGSSGPHALRKMHACFERERTEPIRMALHQGNMEEAFGTSFSPFAKQSRLVSRREPDEAAAGQRHPYDPKEQLWEWLYQPLSPPRRKEDREPIQLLVSGFAARSPNMLTDVLPCPALCLSQELPSPRELCRQRRGQGKCKRVETSSVTSVCSHLAELKRRQSSIDELKKQTWGGYMSHTASEDQDGTAEIPRDSLTHRATLTALWPGNVDLLFGGWSKQPKYPGWSPDVGDPYELAPMDEPPLPAPCCLLETFWGFGWCPEE
ncbi:protein INCA1 [Alligator mississippiensis]|uniref:Protein INCA1 n=1 Tax=Alligator mississippiensis TaxID=8496 RepID=A0A151MVT5_ALLMI|nr:protein INCA1 [Alligator mississippiensis]